MNYRFATPDDVFTLTRMNRQLVEDEGHRNRFKPDAWFEERMRRFLIEGYEAVLFELGGEVVAYALYTDHPDHGDTIYLRQIFVDRAHRGQGIGRKAMALLQEEIWPRDKRLTVEVLVGNQVARAFYEAVGFREYSLELEIPALERISVDARTFLGATVSVSIDRPLGSRHPEQGFVYPVNYGFVPNVPAPDGEDLDAYVLGVFEPVEAFTGECIAVVHRLDDDDDKLVVVPVGKSYTDEQIAALVEFQERFFESSVTRRIAESPLR
jgi:inorganic pyrophosphatase